MIVFNWIGGVLGIVERVAMIANWSLLSHRVEVP